MLRLRASSVILALALTISACGASSPGTDAGKDAGKDATVAEVAATEAGGDAGSDAVDAPAIETGSDAAADAAAEAAPDASAEAAPDAPADTAPDAPAEMPADAGADVDPACLTIPVDATRTVHLRITADNECEVFVNGADVGMTTSWPSPVTLDVSLFIHPGRVNVIGVMARNTSSQGGADRGIIGELDDITDGGSKVVIVTDGAWRSSKIERSGWPALLYDDSGWDLATVVGNHGDAPWGALLGTSNAKWLWSAPVPASTADKPNEETAFFRRVFYFGTDGTTITDKPSCP